jgi:hypothetical protein
MAKNIARSVSPWPPPPSARRLSARTGMAAGQEKSGQLDEVTIRDHEGMSKVLPLRRFQALHRMAVVEGQSQ